MKDTYDSAREEEVQSEIETEKETVKQAKLSDIQIKKLKAQVETEYNLAKKQLEPKITEWLRRLKLYNNQRRDQAAIGDPLLFTIMQTVLASLYDDDLMIEWMAREEGDQEVADNLNALSKFDYALMEKDIVDYEWDWDTMFFGRGILLMTNFDRKKLAPVPEVIDPITFLRDPIATSINGTAGGKNAARYLGREIQLTKYQMEGNSVYFNVDQLKPEVERLDSLMYNAQQARAEAQGRQMALLGEEDVKDNVKYQLLEWFTHFEGKKVLVTTDKAIKVIVRYQVLDLEDFPLLDRSLYPTAHDWDNVSIPDIVEDKQRARSVLQNLGLKIMKADMYPMYIFDKNRVKNRAELNFGFNKFIPVNGDPSSAVVPMHKASPNLGMADFIINSLDTSVQKATATPDMQQGAMGNEQRTLGELNLVASKVDTRYSLAAKVFGWSEKRFWRRWYAMYKKHFKKGIDEKVVRLVGAFGAKWRPFTRENIIGKVDPDVHVESRVVAEAIQLKKQQQVSGYMNMVFQDPAANRRYGIRKLGQLHGLEKDELERLLPPTIDELVAESQNELLNKDKIVPVDPADNHAVHLEIHAKAAHTDATFAHIQTHKEAMVLKRSNPELFPETAEQAEGLSPGEHGQTETARQPAGQGQQAPATGGTAQVPVEALGMTKE